MKKVKFLGIDFGSSNTAVVGIVENEYGQEEYVEFRYSELMHFFTVALQREDGWLFFEKAAMAAQGDDVLVTDIKERFSDVEPPVEGKEFLKYLVKCLKEPMYHKGEYDFSTLEGICFGHPAYFNEGMWRRYRENMEKALKEAFGIQEDEKRIQIQCVPEPTLAALAYHDRHSESAAYAQKVRDDEVLLVLDFGGFTFDVALMRACRKDGRQQLESLGQGGSFESTDFASTSLGKKLTQELCRRVYQMDSAPFDYNVDAAKCELFSTDYDTYETPARDLKFCGGKQFRLKYSYNLVNGRSTCTDTDALVHVGMAIGSDDKENIDIEDSFAHLAGVIEGYLEREMNSHQISRIHHILFTGGAARMKPLRNKILRNVQKHCAYDEDIYEIQLLMDEPEADCKTLTNAYTHDPITLSSENAVALGACLVAAGKCRVLGASAERRRIDPEAEMKKAKQERDNIKRDLDLSRMAIGTLFEFIPPAKRDEVRRAFANTLKPVDDYFSGIDPKQYPAVHRLVREKIKEIVDEQRRRDEAN